MNLYDLERAYNQMRFIYGIKFFDGIIFVERPMLVGDLVFFMFLMVILCILLLLKLFQ